MYSIYSYGLASSNHKFVYELIPKMKIRTNLLPISQRISRHVSHDIVNGQVTINIIFITFIKWIITVVNIRNI
jgi:hypothetical protein